MSLPSKIDQREQSLATIHRALDLGITLFDTADIYAPSWDTVGHNEALVGEALRAYSGDLTGVVIATKGGITRRDGEGWGRDSSKDALLAAAERSRERLGVEVIDLYQHHRHDPAMTYLSQMQALAAVRDAGIARRIGVSNVELAELDLALDVVGGPEDGGVVSVQNEWSPRSREHADVLARCEERGIAFLPWSPLGGAEEAHEVGTLYQPIAQVAGRVGASPQEVVLAWLLSSSVVIPIPGATRSETIDSIVRAASVDLTGADIAELDAVPTSSSMFPETEPRSPLR